MNREDGRDGAGRGEDNREESSSRRGNASGFRGDGGRGGTGDRRYGQRGEDRRESGDRGERSFRSDRGGFRERGSGGPGGGFGGRYGSRDRDDRGGRGGRPERSFGDRGAGFGGRSGSRPGGDDRPRRTYGDRDGARDGARGGDRPQRSYGDRSQGDRSYGDRDASRADRPQRSYGDRPQRSYGDRDERSGPRPFSRGDAGGSRTRYGKEEEPRQKEKLPELEPDITPDELDQEVRSELRSLPNDLAELVANHLVAAARALGSEEPERAYEHAKVARRFAGRVGVVREAAGIAAYHAGQYAEALGDLRAARRMTGSDAYLPIMADCERGLGRPERALDLVRSREAEKLDREGKIELAIVESGARRDLGQHDAAVITLQRLPELRDPQPKSWSARLSFAYADALADAGHDSAATDWFARAMAFDEDGQTDAAERYAELTGAVIEDLEEDVDDADTGDEELEKALDEFDDQGSDDQGSDDQGDIDLDHEVLAESDDFGAGRDGRADHAGGRSDESGEYEDEDLAGEAGEEIVQADSSDAADDDSAGAGTMARAEESRGDEPGDEKRPMDGALDTELRKAEGESPEPRGDVAALGPAFIEPDFGDVLADPEDGEKPKG